MKPIENKILLIGIDLTHYHKFYDELYELKLGLLNCTIH